MQTFIRERKLKKISEINETMAAFFMLTPPPPPKAAREPIVETVVTAKKEVACREIYVARYGKIYKRKAPSPTNCIKLNCAPGLRYCKLCDAHKPLVAFYTAVKRYVCRKCHKVLAPSTSIIKIIKKLKILANPLAKDRVGKRLKERIAADITEGKTTDTWFRMSNARIWFGIPKIQFDSTTIKDIIKHASIPWNICPMPCPIDPSLPMRPRNVAILSARSYNMLMRLWKHTCSRGTYVSFVQRSNLIPPRFDVAFPCDAYHNKLYLRPIIDVGPMLLKEQEDLMCSLDGGCHDTILELQGHSLDAAIPAAYLQKYSRVLDAMFDDCPKP